MWCTLQRAPGFSPVYTFEISARTAPGIARFFEADDRFTTPVDARLADAHARVQSRLGRLGVSTPLGQAVVLRRWLSDLAAGAAVFLQQARELSRARRAAGPGPPRADQSAQRSSGRKVPMWSRQADSNAAILAAPSTRPPAWNRTSSSSQSMLIATAGFKA